jgi:hypothetical protein
MDDQIPETQADFIRQQIEAEDAAGQDPEERPPRSLAEYFERGIAAAREAHRQVQAEADAAAQAADAAAGFPDDAALAKFLDMPIDVRRELFREAAEEQGQVPTVDFMWRLRRAIAGPLAAQAMDAAAEAGELPAGTPSLMEMWTRSPRGAAMVASLFGTNPETGEPYVRTAEQVRAAEAKEQRARDAEGRFVSQVFRAANTSPAAREIAALRAEIAQLKAERRANAATDTDDNRPAPVRPMEGNSILTRAQRDLVLHRPRE